MVSELPEDYNSRLKANKELIQKELEPQTIADTLLQRGILRKTERDTIMFERSKDKRIKILISYIELMSGDNFKIFLDVLKYCNYSHIAYILGPHWETKMDIEGLATKVANLLKNETDQSKRKELLDIQDNVGSVQKNFAKMNTETQHICRKLNEAQAEIEKINQRVEKIEKLYGTVNSHEKQLAELKAALEKKIDTVTFEKKKEEILENVEQKIKHLSIRKEKAVPEKQKAELTSQLPSNTKSKNGGKNWKH